MSVYSFIKSKLFGEKDTYNSLSINRSSEPVVIFSEALQETLFFRKINAGEWQAIDAMKTSLADAIINQKVTIKDAYKENYVFDLIKISWVDSEGKLLIDSEKRFKGLSNGEISANDVNEISRLALQANGFLINSEDLKKK